MTERVTARQRLLSAAAELFYAEGVGATGIDAITAHAGAPIGLRQASGMAVLTVGDLNDLPRVLLGVSVQ